MLQCLRLQMVSRQMTHNVSSKTLNATIPYTDREFKFYDFFSFLKFNEFFFGWK